MYNSPRFRGSHQQNRQHSRFEYNLGNTYQMAGAMAHMNVPQIQGSFQQNRFASQGEQPGNGNYPQQFRQPGMPLTQQSLSPGQQSMRQHQQEVIRDQQMFHMEQEQQRNQENYLRIQREKQMQWRLQEKKAQKIQTRVMERQQPGQRTVLPFSSGSPVNSASRKSKTWPDHCQGKIASTSDIPVHCPDNKSKTSNSPTLALERKQVLKSKSQQSSINAKNLIDLSPGKTNVSKSPRTPSQTKITSSQTSMEGAHIQAISSPVRRTEEQLGSETNERQRVIVEIIIEEPDKKIEEAGAVDNTETGKLETEEILLESKSLLKERERQVAKRSKTDTLKKLKKPQSLQSESKLEQTCETQTVDDRKKLTVTPGFESEVLVLESKSLLKEREKLVAKRSKSDTMQKHKEHQSLRSESKIERTCKTQTVDDLKNLTVTDPPDLESEVLVLKHMSELNISNATSLNYIADEINADTEIKGALHGQDLGKDISRNIFKDEDQPGFVKDLQEIDNSAKILESATEIESGEIISSEGICSFVNIEVQDDGRTGNNLANTVLVDDATEKRITCNNINSANPISASEKILDDCGGEKTTEYTTDLEVNETEETLCRSDCEEVGRIGVINSTDISRTDNSYCKPSAFDDLLNKGDSRLTTEHVKNDSGKISLMTDITKSVVEIEKYVASSPDVNDIIDKIDKILVDNASVVNSEERYEVLTEAISDEEFETKTETDNEGNYTVTDTILVADPGTDLPLTNDNIRVIGNDVKNLNSNQSDELIKGQVDLQLKIRGFESPQGHANYTDVKNNNNGEDHERNSKVHEKVEEVTVVTEDENKKKKSYIEYMEVEDISPPLSVEPELDSLIETNVVCRNNNSEITSGFSQAENFTCKTVENSDSLDLRVNNSATDVESSNMRRDTVTELNVANSGNQNEFQIYEENKNEKHGKNNNFSQIDMDSEKNRINNTHNMERNEGNIDDSMEIDVAAVPKLSDDQKVYVDKMTSEEEQVQLKTRILQDSASECVVELERLDNDLVQRLSRPSSQETSNKPQRLNSQSSQESQKDRGHSQSWQLGSSDDDDDDLLDTIPAFLQSVQEISDRPLPLTPDHFSTPSHSQDSNPEHGEKDPATKSEAIRPTLKSRFSLDDLLHDREKSTSAEQKRIDEIHSECKKDIQEGGFITFLDRVEEETTEELALPEENRQILDQLNVEESQISDDRPGCCVFDRSRYCCLFGASLHPTHCGFTVGSGKYMEKHLESLQLDQYQRLLTTSIIQMTFEKVQCQGQLMRWLFFLMSIHSDYLIRHGCHRIVMDILHTQQLKGKQKWSPTVADVLTVFVNYGATLDGLLVSSNFSQDTLQVELFGQPNHTPTVTPPDHHGYNIDNLLLVLEVLAYSLKDKSSKYTGAELTVLLTTLMTVSLDTKLESFCAFDAFSICVHNVLHQYPEAEWNKKKISICQLISQVSCHHHDKLVVAQLLPMDTRGSYLQRRTSFIMLEDLCDVERLADEELDKLQIHNLYQFVSYMKDLVHTDPYKLSSVITLMDLSVGNNSSLSTTEREELRCLMDQVKRLSGEVRDNVRMLDRTRVKDMMFRVTSRWSLDIQATKGKQSKIFEYVKRTPRQIKVVETVQTVQSNEDSDDSDSEFEPDGNQEQTPCKMPRLEPCVDDTLKRNPKICDDSSRSSEQDCFNVDTDKTVRDNLKSGHAADEDYINIDDDDDLPEL